jgi:capsular polysaccharide biosynthesis protein
LIDSQQQWSDVMPSADTIRPLTSSDFSFVGFDDLMLSVDETLQEVGIRSGPPQVSVVENAIFVPGAKVPTNDPEIGRFVHEGGIVTQDGELVELAQTHRSGTRWGTRVLGGIVELAALEPERVIDEEVVYLGWCFQHFGHFLMESLTRTWILGDIDPSVKVVFHTKLPRIASGQKALSAATQRILELFGIPLERIIFPQEPTRLRRVIVPESLHELSYGSHEQFPRRYRQVASSIAGDTTPSAQPVYLSRRLLPSHLRQIVGEFELEEVLRDNGFLIAHPETMRFEDQIRLINQHTDIFTTAGSAAYNVLFALHRPRLHMLTSGVPRADYFLTPAVAETPTTYCNFLGRGGRPGINKTPTVVEISKCVDYLDSHGFLKKRLRASLASQDRNLQNTFDEVWFYAMVQDVPADETLAPDVERDALVLAGSSWPLSLILAQYYQPRNDPRVDDLTRQFADLVEKELDTGRLVKFYEDVESAAIDIILSCAPDVAERMTSVLSDRFLMDDAEIRRRAERRDRFRKSPGSRPWRRAAQRTAAGQGRP